MTLFPRRGTTVTRLTPNANMPASYDGDARSVEVVISTGSAVRREYGTEVLRISKDAIDLSRLKSAGVPLLDSHSQASVLTALGRVADAWISNGKLVGTLRFNDTAEGHKAEKMVANGELVGISAGYQVKEWSCIDVDGNKIDAEDMRVWGEDLTFTAERWQLLECSLVAVPADAVATVRSAVGDFAFPFVLDDRSRILTRMQVRQRMHERMQRMDQRARARQRMYDRQERRIGTRSVLWHERVLRRGVF